jgi:hypothetical protein
VGYDSEISIAAGHLDDRPGARARSRVIQSVRVGKGLAITPYQLEMALEPRAVLSGSTHFWKDG